MKKIFITYLIVCLLCFSCKTETKNTPQDIYQKTSNEFISKLLELRDFNCNCIIEPKKKIIRQYR
jgi:hypothetical protein